MSRGRTIAPSLLETRSLKNHLTEMVQGSRVRDHTINLEGLNVLRSVAVSGPVPSIDSEQIPTSAVYEVCLVGEPYVGDHVTTTRPHLCIDSVNPECVTVQVPTNLCAESLEEFPDLWVSNLCNVPPITINDYLRP